MDGCRSLDVWVGRVELLVRRSPREEIRLTAI